MASSLRTGSDSATLAEADVAVLFETSSLFINHAVRVDTARARGSCGCADSCCHSCCHYTREDKLFENTLILIVKLRERERHRVDQGKKMDGGWWMVDILSLMLYTKFG